MKFHSNPPGANELIAFKERDLCAVFDAIFSFFSTSIKKLELIIIPTSVMTNEQPIL